jgi:hypothetical protein
MLQKDRVLLCVLFVGKTHDAKDIHEQMIPLYGGKCLSRKLVHNWVANVQQMTRMLKRCGSGWDKSQKASMLRFRGTGKAMGQMYQSLWRIFRGIHVFSRFEYYNLRFLSICDLFTKSPSYDVFSRFWEYCLL